MIFSERTYRKFISLFLLSSYILVSLVSLFHYHHVDLSRANSVSNFNSDTLTEFGYFDGKNFICTIHHNFSLLHNVSGINISCHSPDLQTCENITVFITESYYSLFNFSNVSLRAPPIYS